MDIIVIGAGIVGLSTAWALQKDGHRVTVVDAHDRVGAGTSEANGGQLSYRYVAPLADPDILAKIPGWMLRSDAPVRFRPRFDPAQWRWLLQFLAACNTRDKQHTVAALLPLSLLSRAIVHEWVDVHRLQFDFVRNGKLIVHRDPSSFHSARALLAAHAELAEQQQALDADACVALEPALRHLRNALAGGIHTPSEDAGDCLKLCEALARTMQSGANPVSFTLGSPITRLLTNGGRLSGVTLGADMLQADAVVLCTGIATQALLAPLGLQLPILAVKGYSLTLALTADSAAPSVSVTDYQRKIVYARLGTRLRVAGMADITGADAGIVPARVATLRRETREAFGDWTTRADASAWSGLRPATPGGRPIVDRAPGLDNLWLNVGHGALGFTLAAGCGALVADRIAGRPASIPDEPFSIEAALPLRLRRA